MLIPPKTPNEAERQAELEAFDILDTLPEETYDAITFLASEICDAPIALVSIVDEERQWFKAKVGLEISEGPREFAFCSYAILEPDSMLIVSDATEDERFCDNPYVTGEANVRFYAGAPLITASGNALGTLCVIDSTPRELTPAQGQALQALAKQVMALLDLRWTIQELNRKQIEIEAVMRQRETFIATVSHEIRTPLSAVIGYVELLSDPDSGISGFERNQMLATVARQAGDVAELIEDLLVAAKAQAGTLRVQSVSVDLTAQTAQVLEGLDPIRVASLRVSTPPARAVADPGRVRQVIRNLITNAFRYGGSDIEIGLRRLGDLCVLEVSDDGPGVAPDDEQRIFETFQQSSAGPDIADSVGLGLPISRLLSELMGGELTYSRRDARTVFTLELPAWDTADNPAEPVALYSGLSESTRST